MAENTEPTPEEAKDTLENKVEAAYMHGTQIEKRRKLMQDWADYVDLPQVQVENVIPLKSVNA